MITVYIRMVQCIIRDPQTIYENNNDSGSNKTILSNLCHIISSINRLRDFSKRFVRAKKYCLTLAMYIFFLLNF